MTEQTTEQRLREALEWIRNRAFYHMTRHVEGTSDRRVLGEIKEFAIKMLREVDDEL
jgi:hypothetical protein